MRYQFEERNLVVELLISKEIRKETILFKRKQMLKYFTIEYFK